MRISHKEQKVIIERAFGFLGFKVIFFNDKPTANGVDCYVQKDNKKPKSVEIKTITKQTRCTRCEPVSKQRVNDDLIAILFNADYVLIQPMKEHLSLCSKNGSRPLGWSQ